MVGGSKCYNVVMGNGWVGVTRRRQGREGYEGRDVMRHGGHKEAMRRNAQARVTGGQ